MPLIVDLAAPLHIENLERNQPDFEFSKQVILKGLRAVSDLEFEYAMALMNRRLDRQVDTLFLMTSDEYSYLSSSLVKEVARLGGALDGLVPDVVAAALERKFHGGANASPDAQVSERS